MSESAVIGAVDGWLAREFAPHRMGETIRALADAQPADEPRSGGRGEAASKIAECDQKLTQYRAALDAGASPATVAVWIAETEAEKAHYEIGRRQVAKARERMTEREIKSIVDKLADIARVLADADADDKSEIFRRLGLKLTYHPGRRLVEARITPDQHGFFESVRGPTAPINQCMLMTEFSLVGGGGGERDLSGYQVGVYRDSRAVVAVVSGGRVAAG